MEGGKQTKEGVIYSFQVADESGSIIANFWNEVGACITPGDILLVGGGFVTMFRNQMRFACRQGVVMRTGRIALRISLTPDMSLPVWLPNPANEAELVRWSVID